MSIAIFPPEVKELEGGGGGGTIALNFGFDEQGMGDNYTSPDPVSVQPQTAATTAKENPILTSNNDDAVAIKETPKKDDKKPVDKIPDTKPATTTTTPTKPQPDKSVTNAIGNLLGGDGNSNKAGNQGKPSGNLNSQGYDGDGSGGSGTGSGGGNGSGQGLGTGSGYGSGSGGGIGSGHGDYKLEGRKRVSVPQIQYKCNESGVVVISITVDKSGKVVKAERGRGGKNDVKCLVDVAIQIALDTKFDENSLAPHYQYGTITFNLKAQ